MQILGMILSWFLAVLILLLPITIMTLYWYYLIKWAVAAGIKKATLEQEKK